MKSTLADIRQLFNVKAIADASLSAEDIPANTFGIIDESTNLTVKPANFAAIPDKIRFVSKLNGKVYYSPDIVKDYINQNSILSADYTAGVANSWTATIEHCDCINGFQVVINIDDQALIQQSGFNWGSKDIIVDVAPSELLCLCSCDGKFPVYENNVITKHIADKLNSSGSDFYTASVSVDLAGSTTGTTAPAGGAQGDIYVRTGATAPGTYVNTDGTAWVLIGDINGVLTDIDTFIEATKDANTTTATAEDGALLSLIITGVVPTTPIYNDLEGNYVYPRGTKLNPVILLNGNKTISFTEVTELGYEIGAGYDLRAEEFENMNNYTNLNHYHQTSEGYTNPNLVYQFENNTNYNTITFEAGIEKSGLEEVFEGRTRKVNIILGTSVAGVYTDLKAMFDIP